MTTAIEQDTRPLSRRLKEDNWDLHQVAENDALPRHMIAGTMPKDVYADMIGQMYLANTALDEAIVEHRDAVPVLKQMVTDRQLQGQYLRADLEHHGVDVGSLEAKPGTVAVIEKVNEYSGSDPLSLFGLHYVREGANNGNRFVAMKLKKAWGIDMETADGFRYLDPYGKDQRPLWDDFKVKLDEQELTDAEKVRVVAAAREMFKLIMATHKDHHLPDLPPADKDAAHGHAVAHAHAGTNGGGHGGGGA